MSNLIGTLITLLVLSGCGQAPAPNADASTVSMAGPTIPVSDSTPTPTVSDPSPVPSASPSPSPSPTPSPTVVNFGYFNSTGICDAVKNWVPEQTTIVFPVTMAGTMIFNFTWSGITMSNPDGSGAFHYTGTITKAGPIGSLVPLCVITVADGQLVSVH